MLTKNIGFLMGIFPRNDIFTKYKPPNKTKEFINNDRFPTSRKPQQPSGSMGLILTPERKIFLKKLRVIKERNASMKNI